MHANFHDAPDRKVPFDGSGEKMISAQAESRPPLGKSWLGICSWAMALMAVSLIVGWEFYFPNEVNKLQRLELIILMPLSWFLHLLGLGFGVVGWKRRLENPFAVSGTMANLVLLLLTMLVLRLTTP